MKKPVGVHSSDGVIVRAQEKEVLASFDSCPATVSSLSPNIAILRGVIEREVIQPHLCEQLTSGKDRDYEVRLQP